MYQFTLPSGIDVELREMTGAEEELLTNQRLVRSGDAINQVLKNCIVSLGEEKTVEVSHVQDMLSGDRLALLVYLRQISLGDTVELELQCPNSGCRARTFVTVDLKELESSSYGEEREFDFKLPGSNSNVKFGYLDGHKEKRLALLKEQNITSAMLMRIITIDDKPPSKKLLADMSMKDRSALRAEMSRVDAGIKTTIECDCEQCGTLIKTRLEAEPSFCSRSTLIRDAFFLAYGGLHWSFSEVRSFPISTRKSFVEVLEKQLEFEREQAEKKKMNGDLGLGIVVSMKDAFTRNAQKIQGAMMDLDATVAASSERMSRNMDRIQKGTMMVGAGLSLLAIPTALIASTAATQKALGELSSLGVEDLTAIEDAAESFTNKWSGANKADFIGATYDVKSALSNLSDEAVGVFTQMAALTGKATKASTQEMVGTFTTAYGIFKPIMADMTDMEWATAFSGAMSQTVASFKTNGTQMADAIKNIGAVAAASNVPLEEQLAVLGQLQTTMPGSEAGTLYKAFIMKAAEAGKGLGLSFVDSMGKLKGVVPILQEIQGKFPDLSQAAAQVELKKAFGSDEAVKFILQMSAGVESLDANIQNVAGAMKTGTVVTEKMANAMNQDVGAGWDLIKQQFHNLSEILGKTLLPVVQPVMKGVSSVILFLQRLAKSMPNITRAVLTFSMALGGILVVAGAATSAIGMIGIMLPAIQAGIAAIGTVAASVGAAISTYFLPVIAVVGAIVLAVYILKKAWESNFGGIRDFVVGVWDKVKLAFEGIRTLVSSLSGGVGQMSADLAGKLQKAGLMGFVVTVFKVYYRIREYLRGLWEAFSASFSAIRSTLEPVVTGLVDAFSDLFGAFGNILEALGLVSTAADASSFKSFGAIVGTVLGGVAQVGAYIIRFLFTPLTLAVKLIAWVTKGITWFVKVSADSFIAAGKWAEKFLLPVRLIISLVKTIGKVVKTVFGIFSGNVGVIAGLQEIGKAVLDYFLTPFYWARDSVAGVFSFIRDLFSSAGQFFTNVGNSILNGFLNLPIISTLRTVCTKIKDLLNGDLISTMYESGKSVLTTFAEGVKHTLMAPVRWIKSGVQKIRDWLPGSDAKVGPLSSLTASGKALMETVAGGMQMSQGAPVKAVSNATTGIMGMFSSVWSLLPKGAQEAAMLVSSKLGGIDGSIQSQVVPPENSIGTGFLSGITQSIQGVMNIAPKLNGMLVPKMLQAALALTPVMAGELPSLTSLLPVSAAVSQQESSRSQSIPVANDGTVKGKTSFEPVPSPLRASNTSEPQQNQELASIRLQLQELASAITALGNRPMDVSVTTNIDGRKVAESVFKEMQDRKIRNYETL